MHVKLIGALALLLSAAVAVAAPKKPAPTYDPRQEKIARANFERAEKAFTLERFDEALEGYQAAYEALPLPAFLFNIAQCHRNLGHHERAVFFYQRYLSLAPDAPNRRVVEDLIAEQKRALEPPAAAPEEGRPPKPVDLGARPEPPPPPGGVVVQPAPARKDTWKTTRWWLTGALAAGLVAGVAIFLLRPAAPLPSGSLGTIDTRH